MSVNYCQLSSPGYKEEQLRRSEVGLDIFSKMEEFTFVSYTRSSGRNYYRHNNHVTMYDMTSIHFEPQTSANFDITDSYLRAKQTGMYAFYSELSVVDLLISDKWISHNKDVASVVLVKKGQMVKFKIANSNAEGRTLTILRMN